MAMEQYGLLGFPLLYSLSPPMHRAAFQAIGRQATYSLWPVEAADLGRRLAELRQAAAVRGFNVTVPHKEAVLTKIDELAPAAEAIGAVNTVRKVGSKLIGDNTDARGFIASLQEIGVSASGARALVLGAGGAARAVCYGLLKVGVEEIYLLNRTRARAEALIASLADQRIRLVDAPSTLEVLSTLDLVVNATSCQEPWLAFGLAAEVVWPLGQGLAVDLAYGDMLGAYLSTAAASGWQTLSGEGMLLHQAAAAFELWTGQPAPVSAMRIALRKALVSND